ncbi:hypothetical protein HPP92_016743 [Vanilla planifolia]|uniref:Uncharacterized protein n=1 Tax=Vanilla planifolia TaxID=51239 RepID=A0A835QJX0_VANPL|nr:hypothetical protein HPP92_016743 [Vanilla planifolia]
MAVMRQRRLPSNLTLELPIKELTTSYFSGDRRSRFTTSALPPAPASAGFSAASTAYPISRKGSALIGPHSCVPSAWEEPELQEAASADFRDFISAVPTEGIEQALVSGAVAGPPFITRRDLSGFDQFREIISPLVTNAEP